MLRPKWRRSALGRERSRAGLRCDEVRVRRERVRIWIVTSDFAL